MPSLVAPTTSLHAAWLAAHDDWGPGDHEDGFGLHSSDDVRTPAGFAAWIARLRTTACVYRWILHDAQVAGGIALRLGPPDLVLRLGHIGYGIRPAFRRRGLASWALGRMLDEARDAGLSRVLLVCEAGNEASARTVVRLGGVPEAGADDRLRRYRIGLG